MTIVKNSVITILVVTFIVFSSYANYENSQRQDMTLVNRDSWESVLARLEVLENVDTQQIVDEPVAEQPQGWFAIFDRQSDAVKLVLVAGFILTGWVGKYGHGCGLIDKVLPGKLKGKKRDP